MYELDSEHKPVGTTFGSYTVTGSGTSFTPAKGALSATKTIINDVEETGKLTVTKEVKYNGSDDSEATGTFYVALFDGEELFGEVKAISVTAGTGTVEFTGLKVGKTYTLKETKADGTEIAGTTGFEYTVTYDKQNITATRGDLNQTATITNNCVGVYVAKVDIADSKEIEGAHLQVLVGDTVIEEWDSTSAVHLVKGLDTDLAYILRETTAPEGYAITSDFVFTIDQDGAVDTLGNTTTDEEGNIVILVEDEKTSVSISKVDVADGKELEGAHIQILDKNDNVVEEWDSTKEAHIVEGLHTGEEYTLRETVAPNGYSITSDTKFTIAADGKVTTTGSKTTDADGNTVLLVEDSKIVLSFLKKSSDGSTLSGAVFRITKNDGTIVEEWTSNDAAHDLSGKLIGGATYTLHEVSSPQGYAEINDIEFTVNTDGTFTGFGGLIDENGVVTLTDQKLVMNVNKTDMTGENELDGAVIELFDSAGNKLDSWTSKAGEKHDFGEKLNAEQTYTLRETTAPTGYGKVTDITFSVSKTGEVTITGGTLEQDDDGTWIIKDELIDLKTVKTDASNGAGLGGAVLRVYANNGTKVDEWTSVAGEAHDIGKNLTPGGYFIREVTAPSGYNKVGDIKFTVDAQGKVVGLNLAKDANGNYIIADSRITSTPEETPEEPKTPETPKEPDKPKEEEEKPEDEDDEEEDEEIPEIPDIETPEGGHEEFYTDENGVEWVIVYGPDGKVLGRRRVLGAGRARTGDESNLPLWGGMAAASMLGIGAVALYTKRKREDEEE